MGTPQFAATILEELAQHYDIVAAYTQPDKVRGRGKKLVPTPVRVQAEELGIPVYTPQILRDADAQAQLRDLKPDMICVAAYGMILPKDVLDIPPFGCINVHASLLPKWRGAAPIERAVLAGDEQAGVCIMRMEEGLDTGDWCVRREIPISGLSSQQVEERLACLGASALLTAIEQISSGEVHWMTQDDSQATYADKIQKGELDLDPTATVDENLKRVLASNDTHPSKACIAGKDVIVQKAAEYNRVPTDMGSITVDRDHLILGCSDGSFEVLELKPAGKSSMPVKAFLQGFRPNPDAMTWSRP